MTPLHEDHLRRAGGLVAAVGLSATLAALVDISLGGALGPLAVRLAMAQPVAPLTGALEAGVTGSLVWLAFAV